MHVCLRIERYVVVEDVADIRYIEAPCSDFRRHLRRFAATRKFLTLFFGVLEPDTGTLRYVSAGHNPALLVRKNGGTDHLESTGVPVGMLPNSSWKEEMRVMQPGDLLCVYSDGLTEAVNSSDEEYGLDRLSREIESRRDHPAKTLCGEILDSVEQFASGMPQYDDQTLMLLRRTETTG